MTLGEKIRQIRGKRSLAEFSLLIGKPKNKVIQYEANISTPSLRILSRIAEIDNVTVEWLLDKEKTH
jgi:transcriptional regulator with XRE-family HTH domain